MSFFDTPQPDRCASCMYAPGTHDDGTCPFDCEAMAQGYIASKGGGGSSHFGIAGNAYIDSDGNIRIDPLMPLFQGFTMNRKGWICPKCDNAVSPDEKTCPHCKPKPKQEGNDGKPTHITE